MTGISTPLTLLPPDAIIRLKALEAAVTITTRASYIPEVKEILKLAREFEAYMAGETGNVKASVTPPTQPGANGRRGSG